MAHEQWRLLYDTPADGATNMARDEALLEQVTTPTLRLYSWRPTCLSLGRHQPVADVRLDLCAQQGVDVVRRPSGGRALLHAAELTYCLVLPVGHWLAAGSVLDSYRRISAALLDGLAVLGVTAVPAPTQGPRRTHAAACFAVPAAYEPLVQGRKLLGSAQMRREGAVLQHGALPLSNHVPLLTTLLSTPAGQLDAYMIALDEALGRAVSADEVSDAICAAVERAWNVTLCPGTLSAVEQARAEALVSHYASKAWTLRR